MTILKKAVALVAYTAFGTAAISVPAHTQPGEEGSGPPALARSLLPARAGGVTLLVTSNGLQNGGSMDERFTQDGDNMSPPLRWSRGPSGTRSYAVIVEDTGVDRPEPIVHWLVYDIPPSIRILPVGVPRDDELESGAKQGKNVRGEAGYIGPKPPAGQTHPYHFQVFALNTRLNMDPAEADRDALLDAMRGHILGSGDIVALYTGK